MRRGGWLVVGVALVAALALVLAWSLLGGDRGGGPAAGPVAAAPPGPAGQSAPVRSAEASSTDFDAGPARSVAATETALASSATGEVPVEVLVVERASGEPLPGARVRYAPTPAGDGWPRSPAWDLSTTDAWLDEHGSEVVADAAGLATVLVPAGGRCVAAAASAGLWGREPVEADADPPVRIELYPDATLEARVVDDAGRPCAGVPVALRMSTQVWSGDRQTTRTDADGLARLPHVGLHFLERVFEVGWSLALSLPLVEPVAEQLDPAALPTEPVVLRLPATGSLEVVVAAPPGGPGVDSGSVDIWHSVQEERPDRPWLRERGPRFSSPIEDGRAVFRHVGLDLELALDVRAPAIGRATSTRGRGPRLAGETARIEVVFGSDYPLLRLQLFDAKGVAASERDVRLVLETETDRRTSSRRSRGRTDADGVLFHVLQGDWEPGRVRTLGVHAEASAGLPPGRVALDLSRPFPDGVTDLGALRLEPLGLLAAGRVVATDGAPVSDAHVRVSVLRDQGRGAVFHEDLPELDVRSGADGGFELRGNLDVPLLRIAASASGWSGEPVDCARGSGGLVLTLTRTGRMEGRVLAEEGLPLGLMMARLYVAGAERPGGWDRNLMTAIQGGGRFVLPRVPPGTYDLELSVPGEVGTPLPAVRGLVVPAGGACDDARLDPVDLRGRLCGLTLELVRPEPDFPLSGTLHIGAAGGAEDARRISRPIQGERMQLLASAPALDLDVIVAGCRVERLRGVRADTRVELQPGYPVRLRLPADTPLPPPPHRLVVAGATGAQALVLGGGAQDKALDEGREALLYIPEPGQLRLVWWIETNTETRARTTGISGIGKPLTILDLPGEQVFVVVPPEGYAGALAGLDG